MSFHQGEIGTDLIDPSKEVIVHHLLKCDYANCKSVISNETVKDDPTGVAVTRYAAEIRGWSVPVFTIDPSKAVKEDRCPKHLPTKKPKAPSRAKA